MTWPTRAHHHRHPGLMVTRWPVSLENKRLWSEKENVCIPDFMVMTRIRDKCGECWPKPCAGKESAASFCLVFHPWPGKPQNMWWNACREWFDEHITWKQPGRTDLYLSNNPSFKKICVYNLHIYIPVHGK